MKTLTYPLATTCDFPSLQYNYPTLEYFEVVFIGLKKDLQVHITYLERTHKSGKMNWIKLSTHEGGNCEFIMTL